MWRMGLAASLALCVLLCAPYQARAADTITVPLTLTAETNEWAISIGYMRSTATGEFECGGQSYHVDFMLGEEWRGTLIAGAVYITADPDEGYQDRQPFPNVLGIGNTLFMVDILLEPPQLVLSPYTGPVGTVRIPIDTERVSIYNPCKKVLLYRAGTEASVPVGDYKLSEYQCVNKDKDGEAWYLCASGTQDSPNLKVREGEPFALDIGGPYTPSLELDGTRSATFRRWRKVAYVDFGMRGKWDENPSEIFPVSVGRREPPGYVVRDPNGKTVFEGSFRYG